MCPCPAICAAGIYCNSNFLLVQCLCAAGCADKPYPQCFGLEEWALHHAHLTELAGKEDEDECEAIVRANVMVLLEGEVNGPKVRQPRGCCMRQLLLLPLTRFSS